MAKEKQINVKFDASVYERIESAAKADLRTLANVVELCVISHLPYLEADISERDARRIKQGSKLPRGKRGISSSQQN